MAHSSHRQRKGCGLCKPHKHRGNGDGVRQPISVARQVGGWKRWNRHDVRRGQEQW